ncbi:MAG TPA: fibronectin type III domain-containing protein [Solirubrobacteraceae bacterium]
MRDHPHITAIASRHARRLTRLLLTLACIAAVGFALGAGATQAIAAGIAEVKLEGTGTVTSNPAGIDCTDTSGPTTGECKTEGFPFSFGAPNIELTATPGPGSRFEGWRGSENVTADCQSGKVNPCIYDQGFLTYEITAIFGIKPPQKDLKVKATGAGSGRVTSTPEGIECGSQCEGEFDENSTVVLIAVPTEHSTFVEWVGCDSITAEGSCELTMSETKAVEAKFNAIPQEHLEVLKTGMGTGEVSSSPAGIDCGTTCAAQFNEGATVVLTATPASPEPGARYTFGEWKGCTHVTGERGCEVTMSEAETVTAEFVRTPQQTLQVQDAGAGYGEVTSSPSGISCGGICEAQFAEASTVTLTATAAAGSNFTGWSGGGCSGTESCEVTLATATGVIAIFEPVPSPTAATGAASDITATAAILAGTVNGEGYDTHYLFDYGETGSYGNEAPANAGVGDDAGITSTGTPVTVELSGLTPNTTYHYQIVAYNIACSSFCPPSGSNTAQGADQTFSTLPAAPGVVTDVPVAVAVDNATVAGEVIAHGASTSYHVDYGKTEALGSSTAAGYAGAGEPGLYVTATLEGLLPNTTYFYRFAAANSGGEVDGSVEAFTTNAAGEPSTGALPPGFSLIGPPLTNSPAVISLSLTGIVPLPVTPLPAKPKPISRKQKLERALKLCRKKTSKPKRQRCKNTAKARYTPKASTKPISHRAMN